MEETKKLTKDELIKLIEQLYVERIKLEDELINVHKELDNLRAKMSGKIGFAAGKGARNPHVK